MTTSTHTVEVKADTTQAVAEIEKLGAAVLANAPKSGLKTTELWVVLLTLLDDFLLARFGHDWGLKGNLPAVAAIASTAAGAVYVWGRTWLKGRHAAVAAQIATGQQSGEVDLPLLILIAILVAVVLLLFGVHFNHS